MFLKISAVPVIHVLKKAKNYERFSKNEQKKIFSVAHFISSKEKTRIYSDNVSSEIISLKIS